MKKAICVLLTAIICVFFFAGCGEQAVSSAQKEEEISYITEKYSDMKRKELAFMAAATAVFLLADTIIEIKKDRTASLELKRKEKEKMKRLKECTQAHKRLIVALQNAQQILGDQNATEKEIYTSIEKISKEIGFLAEKSNSEKPQGKV